jgi:hypothetical protein
MGGGDRRVWRNGGMMIRMGETKKLGVKPVPVAFCPRESRMKFPVLNPRMQSIRGTYFHMSFRNKLWP